MDIQFRDLERMLAEERRKNTKIVHEIEKGNHGAVSKLDPGIFNERNKTLYMLNARAMNGKKRFSEKPYFVHLAGEAFLLSIILSGDPELMHNSIGYALTQDLNDKGAHYDPKTFEQKKSEFGPDFVLESMASVVLGGISPLIYDTVMGERRYHNDFFLQNLLNRIATTMLVKFLHSEAYAYVLLGEKAENALDLEAYEGKDEKQLVALRAFVPAIEFGLAEFNGLLNGKADAFREIVEEVKRARGITASQAHDQLRTYRESKKHFQDRITQMVSRHLETFNYILPEGKKFQYT